jgi:hypothetical protein
MMTRVHTYLKRGSGNQAKEGTPASIVTAGHNEWQSTGKWAKQVTHNNWQTSLA